MSAVMPQEMRLLPHTPRRNQIALARAKLTRVRRKTGRKPKLNDRQVRYVLRAQRLRLKLTNKAIAHRLGVSLSIIEKCIWKALRERRNSGR